MLTVFFGNDTEAVRTTALHYAHQRTVSPTQMRRCAAENLDLGELAALATTQSLFSEPLLYILDTLSSDAERFEELLSAAQTLTHSDAEFIVIESGLTAPIRKVFVEAGATLKEHTRTAIGRFNVFALGDALLLRDRKSLWLLLMDARQAGISTEEIIGTLFWQLKVLRLTYRAGSAAEAGLKPFVYQKAARAHSRISKAEADEWSRVLLTLYHEGHNGETELDLALEAWILSL